MKQIVPNDNCLTPNQILRYLQDETSLLEMRGIDRHIEQCPMCSDAVEGAMALPTAELTQAFSRIQTKISDKSALLTVEKRGMQVVHRSAKRYWLMGAAASVALLVVVGFWFFQDEKQASKAVVATESALEKDISPLALDSSASYAMADAPKAEGKVAGNATVPPKNIPPLISKTQSSIKSADLPPNTVASASQNEYSLVQQMPAPSVSSAEKDDKAMVEKAVAEEKMPQKDKESESALKAKMAEVHTEQGFDISNNAALKTADSNQSSVQMMRSIPDSAPNQVRYSGAANQNVVIPEVKRSGADYSMKAKELSKAKKEVAGLKDDYNYLKAGIRFYEDKQYDIAIGNFNRVIAQEPSGDDYEKALWYLANAYFKKGDSATFKTLLNRIVAEKGKFAAQAERLLKQ